MKFKSILSMGLALGLAGGLVLGTSADADAKKVRWNQALSSRRSNVLTRSVRARSNPAGLPRVITLQSIRP